MTVFSSPDHTDGVYKGTSNDSDSVPVPVPKQIDATNVSVGGETVGSDSLSERGNALSEQFLAEEIRDQSGKLDTVMEDTSIIKEDTSQIKTSQARMEMDVAEIKEVVKVLVAQSPEMKSMLQKKSRRNGTPSHLKGAPSKTPARKRESALPPRSTAKKSKQAEETHLYRQSNAAKEAAEVKKSDGRFHH